jgi:hypothetical protein
VAIESLYSVKKKTYTDLVKVVAGEEGEGNGNQKTLAPTGKKLQTKSWTKEVKPHVEEEEASSSPPPLEVKKGARDNDKVGGGGQTKARSKKKNQF